MTYVQFYKYGITIIACISVPIWKALLLSNIVIETSDTNHANCFVVKMLPSHTIWIYIVQITFSRWGYELNKNPCTWHIWQRSYGLTWLPHSNICGSYKSYHHLLMSFADAQHSINKHFAQINDWFELFFFPWSVVWKNPFIFPLILMRGIHSKTEKLHTVYCLRALIMKWCHSRAKPSAIRMNSHQWDDCCARG